MNPKTKQLIYKAVILFKSFTSEIFVGIESLYKPEGNPSFELISYLMDANLDNIKKVLADPNIKTSDVFACGDIK